MEDDIRLLVRIQFVVIATFVASKLWIRPAVLDSDAGPWLRVFVLSYSNFCEAVAGTLVLTCIGLVVNARWLGRRFSEQTIYAGATAAAAIYVITQELKIHNLGGRNVYDPNDVVFSVLGLVATFVLLLVLEPRYDEAE